MDVLHLWLLDSAVMGLATQIGHSFMENLVCSFDLLVAVSIQLHSFGVIFCVNTRIVRAVLSSKDKYVWIIHGLAQLFVALNPRHEDFFVVELFVFVDLNFIKQDIASTRYASVHSIWLNK
jgi:hypothetical protein